MDKHSLARDLDQNPVLWEILDTMLTDIVNRFPTADPDTLQSLQVEYALAERFATMVKNAIVNLETR